MATNDTQLVIQAAPLDPAFEGDLQELYDHMVERLRIVAPFGISTFVIGTQIPTSNQGPLFLVTATGTSLWVWDDEAKAYVPLDISPSVDPIFQISEEEPTADSVLIWMQIDSSIRPLTLWFKAGSTWHAFVGGQGNTASRPSNPANGTRYFDTDINVELIYERGQWRTLSGSPGDIKFVTHTTLSDAIRINPGWSEVSDSTLGPSVRGRSFAPAHKDAGTTPVQNNPVVAGVSASHAAGDTFGNETHVLDNEETPGWPETHFHGTGQFLADTNDDWAGLVSGSSTTDPGWKADKEYLTREVQGGGPTGSATTHTLTADTQLNEIRGTITSPPLQENDSYTLPTVSPHDNVTPSMALWCLVKD